MTVAGTMRQSAFGCIKGGAHSGKSGLGQSRPIGSIEKRRGVAKRGNRHGVPISENFIIATGPHALMTYGQERGASGVEISLIVGLTIGVAGDVQTIGDIMALEITALSDAIGGAKGFGCGAEMGAYFGL